MHLWIIIRSHCDLQHLSPVTTWTRSSDQRGFAGLILTGFEGDNICSISSLFMYAARLDRAWLPSQLQRGSLPPSKGRHSLCSVSGQCPRTLMRRSPLLSVTRTDETLTSFHPSLNWEQCGPPWEAGGHNYLFIISHWAETRGPQKHQITDGTKGWNPQITFFV